ncbi:hypothetical protein OG401_30610 [Kitasatospora purpeofusca]|uniref:hypothetical protein n=1 Tax=Kitasatospora purpeofusca TaxID=67352 RepID=UPI00224FC0D9|nr:hypothetical protein [Kitasatospora purpeofusca]MCX4688599.1 hypothetical protein [Kitasatospora purpeofusca]
MNKKVLELPEAGSVQASRPNKHRLWLLGGIGVASAAGAVAGAVLLLGGGGEEPGVKQTLCGLQRADGTPLDELLPKGRAATEERKATGPEGDHSSKVSCVISVDGEEAVTLLAFSADANTMPADGGGVQDKLGQVLVGRGSASVRDLCTDNHSLAVMVSVLADPGIWPAPDADVGTHKRALESLARTVLTDQQREVCR